MPSITKKQAREFLENTNEKDKVAIIYHDDLDGFASGILLYDFCKKSGAEVKSFPVILKQETFKEILNNLKNFNKILIADIASFYISKNLEQLKDKQIFYTDHHQKDTEISEFILELRTISQGYIPSSRTCYELTEKENKNKEWLAIAGIITDYGFKYKENEEIINSFLKKEKISLEQYRQQVTHKISNFLIYFKKNKLKAFEILQKIKDYKNLKEINKYAEEVEQEIKKIKKDFEKNHEEIGNINFYYLKSKFNIKSVVVNILSSQNPRQIFVFAKQFEENPNMISLSARYQSENVNLIEIMEKAIKNLDCASVGGHLRAVGGFIQTKDLEKFKQNLKKLGKPPKS